jgi:hypothetical protein
MAIYRPDHIKKLTQMVAKVVGARVQSRMVDFASALIWRMMRVRAGLSSAAAQFS